EDHFHEVSETEQIIITVDEIHEKYLALDLKDRIMTKTELNAVLTLFRRFNLIDLIDRDATRGDSRIIIYPTILFAIRIENINHIYTKLKTYQQGGDGIEDFDESEID